MQPCVYVVYCVDAEGPLYESLSATFERIEERFGMKIETKFLLKKIAHPKIVVPGDIIDPYPLFGQFPKT